MENKIFCYQCQETAGCVGCKIIGVCGKNSDIAYLQDLLIYITKGISEITSKLRKEDKKVSKKVSTLVIENLFTTITNVNFDEEDLKNKIEKSLKVKEELLKELTNKESLSETALFFIQRKDYLNKIEGIGVLSEDDEDKRSLKEIITYGLKGLAAYIKHAEVLKYTDEKINIFIENSLGKILEKNISVEELISLTLETGKYGVMGMELLDKANTENYGNPEITKVNIGVGKNPGILISGHDLKDLEMLLEQTQGTGVDVYTHSEMLPAHYYPKFKKYKNFVGNYGNAWWKQQEEFEAFNGPILMTTNCIVPPKESYKNRIFTTGLVAFKGCKHIEGDEEKDFSEIIDLAKKSLSPKEFETGEILGGFAHNQVFQLADKIVEAVKNGDIKRFVVMGGCDGRSKKREYYTEFAKHLPKDNIILTAGCAKYRYNKLNLGEINGIPRVLDAGQCNDSYSLALIALKLKEIFNLENINDLPIIYNISWYEQKAVIVLLSLLYLGVKNIHLGPTLPAFLSPNVAKFLAENFKIAGPLDI